jgi:hypothetical protein
MSDRKPLVMIVLGSRPEALTAGTAKRPSVAEASTLPTTLARRPGFGTDYRGN